VLLAVAPVFAYPFTDILLLDFLGDLFMLQVLDH
jgi:hypothetical protein